MKKERSAETKKKISDSMKGEWVVNREARLASIARTPVFLHYLELKEKSVDAVMLEERTNWDLFYEPSTNKKLRVKTFFGGHPLYIGHLK